MKLTFALLLLFTLFLPQSRGSGCHCAASNEKTRAGANEMIVVRPPGKYRQVAGVVKAQTGEIVSDVLVEVYDHPEYLFLNYPESEEKKKAQHRIQGCVVGADGKFCIRDLPPGKYELRFSKAGGWNHLHVYVVIADSKQKASSRTLELTMQPGT
jgi:hypothetical protein